MAQAITKGLLRKGNYNAKDIVIIDPFINASVLSSVGLEQVALLDSIESLDVQSSDIVLLAVKPQLMGEVLSGLAGRVNEALIISIAAGIEIDFIVNGLGGGAIRVVRVMPNTPAAIGLGVSIFYANDFCKGADRDLVNGLFVSVGDVFGVSDEFMMHLVTAVSGSGPAYVFYFMEVFVRGAVELGMDEALAWRSVLGVFRGSLGMVEGLDIDDVIGLRNDVTSAGGTTEAALVGLKDLDKIMKRGLELAVERSKEL